MEMAANVRDKEAHFIAPADNRDTEAPGIHRSTVTCAADRALTRRRTDSILGFHISFNLQFI